MHRNVYNMNAWLSQLCGVPVRRGYIALNVCPPRKGDWFAHRVEPVVQFRSAAKRIRNQLSTRGRLQSGLIVQMEPERISHRVCVEPQREKESTAEAASAVLCFVRSCPHRVRVWSESKERKERRRARKERTLMEGRKREGVRGRKRGQGKG
jgi:hypothetical protein